MQNKFPKIFILILNWNGKQDTLECLASVQKIDYPNYKVAVVDNGSTDDSVDSIRDKFPHIHLIENKANLGFAGGNNVGIEYAIAEGADYIFLLNNDTIVDSQVLKTLMQASEKYPDAGILGSKIYTYTDPQKIWYAGANWSPGYVAFMHDGMGKIDNGKDWEEIRESEYICGCAFLIKTEVIKKIGMLETKYFLMWEESDWCYRAKKAGYKCLFIPSSKVWHKISSSFIGGDRAPHYQYFWWRNRLLWIERNINFPSSLRLYWAILKEISRQLRCYLNSQTTAQERLKIKAAWQGVNDYLFRRFGDCPSWVRASIPKT